MTETLELIATTAFGLEAVVRRELAALGYEGTVIGPGRILFSADLIAICRCNLWLRTADRILLRMATFPAADFDALFENTKAVPWHHWIGVDGSFPVVGRSLKSQLSSVPACQRAVKKAVVDSLMTAHGVQTLEETGGTYKIEIALHKDQASLTIDTTGASLHKRGYRHRNTQAPLKETMAAAMVLLSFWNAGRPLIDPFCGSGTIPIEAAMIGRNLAPGRNRTFASESWPNLPAELWESERQAARRAEQPDLDERLIGCDIDPRALQRARENAQRAGVSESVHLQQRDFQQLSSKRQYGCLITNPPYGQRWGERRELEPLYQSIPVVLRRLPTWSHFVLTSYPNFEGLIQKQADRRRKLYNGRIECTYFQFHGPKQFNQPAGTQASPDATGQGNATAGEDRSSAPPPVEKAPVEKAPVEKAPVEKAPVEKAPVEKAPVEKGSVEKGSVEKGSVEKGSVEKGSVEKGSVEKGSAEKGSAEKGSAEKGSAEKGSAEKGPVFGGLTNKGLEQAELFQRRLVKRARHLRRWPTRQGITCYRLYDRDIPEIPLVVDRYEDHLHISEYERPHDRDLGQHADWLDLMAKTAAESLGVARRNVVLKQRGRQRGATQHDRLSEEGREIEVNEGGLKFLVNLTDYVDTGLFLDHRVTRSMVRDAAKGKRVLNLFGYTGSFTVYAADGSATSTRTVDWSRAYLDWARRNLELNKLGGPQHQFERSDVREFVARHPDVVSYDLAIVDPPTFSNSKRTDADWDIQRDYAELLQRLLRLIAPGGLIFFSTNFRRFKFDPAGLVPATVREISGQTVPDDFRNRRIHRCWRIQKAENQ